MTDGTVNAPENVPNSLPDANSDPWFWSDNVPGDGARPDYLSPKYKSVAEQARAYPELYKSYAAAGAPDEYDVSGFSSIDAANENFQALAAFAKENKLSQDAFSGIVKHFDDFLTAQQPDIAAEKAKLGPDADNRIGIIKQWAENTFTREDFEAIGELGNTAAGMQFLDKVRNMMSSNGPNPPMGNNTPAPEVKESYKDIQNEMQQNFKKYNDDPSYRDQIMARFEKLARQQAQG